MEKAGITVKQKESQNFDFFLSDGVLNENKLFLNQFIGIPALPIIGKYQRNIHFMISNMKINLFYDP